MYRKASRPWPNSLRLYRRDINADTVLTKPWEIIPSMPREPPVTMATLPSMLNSYLIIGFLSQKNKSLHPRSADNHKPL